MSQGIRIYINVHRVNSNFFSISSTNKTISTISNELLKDTESHVDASPQICALLATHLEDRVLVRLLATSTHQQRVTVTQADLLA